MENIANTGGITLTKKEAEEYCAYKRQKKISEIMQAMRRSESELTANESAIKLCERASRLRQVAVRMTPSELLQRGEIFKKSPLKIDCVVGGNGETFPKVKAYEAKQAVREGAEELTLVLTASLIESCRYLEIRKEVRRVRKKTKKIPLKVQVEKAYQNTTMLRLARICSEVGASYFSVPYFSGCHLLQKELSRGCLLEVYNVQTLEQFQEMAGVCIGRMVTNHAWEVYEAWIKEAEKASLERAVEALDGERKAPSLPSNAAAATEKLEVEKTTEEKPALPSLPLKPPATPPLLTAALQAPKPRDPETDYHCHIEDGKLKFS